MEEFKKSLYEIYMNYDTVQYLKEENQSKKDIINMFANELEYSEDLTNNLLKYNKSFLKSIAMRIKLKMKKNVDTNEIKDEILSYDKALQPLLEKLLISNSFKNQYNKVIEVTQNVMLVDNDSDIENVLETNVEDTDNEEEENNEGPDNIEVFLENTIEKTDDNSDFIKVSELYKYYCNYCDDENLDKISKSQFKQYLTDKWGKSTKSGYYGYKLKK